MLYVILIAIVIIIIVIAARGGNKNRSNVSGADQEKQTEKKGREPLSETAIQQYTANMEEAYDRLLKDGRDVYPGFPWSAVYTPDSMRSILRGQFHSLIDSPVYDYHLEGIGRFKLSIHAYGKYGVVPTAELMDYIEKNFMDPDLDEAVAWYRKMHG